MKPAPSGVLTGAKMRVDAAKIVVALAIVSALAARLVAKLALGDIAHVMDEITYLFQAKLYAAGRLSAPVSEPRGAFNMWFVDDRWARYGIFPPGWPAALAIALRLGLERWINPILHGITVVLIGRTGERVSGAGLAVVAAALYATSPQTVVLAASLMSHPLVTCCAALVLFACAGHLVERPMRGATGATWLSVGAAIGVVAATRPLCAIVLAAFVLVTFATVAFRGRAGVVRALWLIGVGALPMVLGLLAYNRALTGAPLRFPQTIYFDEHLAPANLPFFRYHKGCNDLGFGPTHGCDYTISDATHTALNAISNVADNSKAWFLLASGPLLVVGTILGLARKATRRTTAWFVTMPLASMALYSLYWHGGTCFGARFYHTALPAALLAAAVGACALPARVRGPVLAATLAWNAFAMTRSARELGDRQWGYWGIDDRFAELRKTWNHGPAVVMVAFGRDDLVNPELGWTAVVPTASVWMLNIRAQAALAENAAVIDEGEIVFAKYHPALVADLKRRFPTRAFYFYVLTADRKSDSLEPYRDGMFEELAHKRPPDNFDGFRIAPPLHEPPPVFRQTPIEN